MAENKTLRLLMPKSLLEAHLLNSKRMVHLKKYPLAT